MRVFLWAVLLSIAIAAPEGMAFAQESGGCPDGYYKTGETTEETADAIIVHPLCKRIRRPDAEIYAERFCRAKKLVDTDISGIKALNFNADVQQFETFEKLSEEQKKEFESKAAMALVDQALEAGKMAADSAKSLNPWNVNTAIKDLKAQKWVKTAEAKGLKTDLVFSAMRRIAAAKNKPDAAAAYKLFVREAQVAREGYTAGRDMAKEPDTAGLRFLLGALKAVEVSPEAGLVVTSAEFIESAAWIYWLNKLENQQMAVTDLKLAQLAKLVKQMKTHVPKLKEARTNWTTAAHKSGEPVCRS